jgi:hypothetical protein
MGFGRLCLRMRSKIELCLAQVVLCLISRRLFREEARYPMNRSVGNGRRFHPVISAFAVLMLLSMIAGGAIFGSARIARAQETPLDTATISPETTLVYASISLATDSDQWQRASDVMVTLGLGSLEDVIADATSDEDSGITFEDLQGGEIGLVVSSLDAASDATSDLTGVTGGLDTTDAAGMANTAASEDGVATIIKVDRPVVLWAKAQADLLRTATERGVTVETTDYEGVTIEFVPGDESTGESGTAQALVGDFIVVANRVEDVEPIIDTANGSGTALSDTENFTKLEPSLEQDFLVFGYINGPALAAAGMTEGSGDLAAIGSISAVTAYTAFVGYIVDAGIRIDSVSVNEDGTAPVLAPSGFSPSLASKVPDDTMLFLDGSDLASTGALDAIALIFAQGVLGIESDATPSAGQSAEEYADEIFSQSAQVIGFNVKTDLIDQLQGEYGLALWGLNLIDPSGLGLLFVSGVENQATVQDVVSKISLLAQSAGGGEFTVSTRTVGESVINTIDLSSSGFPITLSYGVVGENLIISLGSGLEGYLTSQPSSLADSDAYKSALSEVPENPASVFYLDLAQLIPIAESFLGSFDESSSLDVEDANEKCADYNSQEAAQAAYDADSFTNYELDQDFDGTACEDFFAPAGAEASPAPEFNYNALKSIIIVTYEKDGFSGATALLAIE